MLSESHSRTPATFSFARLLSDKHICLPPSPHAHPRRPPASSLPLQGCVAQEAGCRAPLHRQAPGAGLLRPPCGDAVRIPNRLWGTPQMDTRTVALWADAASGPCNSTPLCAPQRLLMRRVGMVCGVVPHPCTLEEGRQPPWGGRSSRPCSRCAQQASGGLLPLSAHTRTQKPREAKRKHPWGCCWLGRGWWWWAPVAPEGNGFATAGQQESSWVCGVCTCFHVTLGAHE